jgi:hypothetical protein
MRREKDDYFFVSMAHRFPEQMFLCGVKAASLSLDTAQKHLLDLPM